MARSPCNQKESSDIPGLLEFSGSSEQDSNLAKQFWIAASLYPHNESQLTVTGGSSQRLPVAPSSSSRPGKLYLQPFPFDKDKETEIKTKLTQIQEAEKKEYYLQKSCFGFRGLYAGGKHLTYNSHYSQLSSEWSPESTKAKKRDEILQLLKKQREERISKELLSLPFKPKAKDFKAKGLLEETMVNAKKSVTDDEISEV